MNQKLIGCPKCDKIQESNSRFCINCGHEINQPIIKSVAKCPKCGNEYNKENNYCPDDGEKLNIIQIQINNNKDLKESPEKKSEVVSNRIGDSPSESKKLSMRWFKFYTYIRMPLVIILSIYYLFMYSINDSSDILSAFYLIFYIILLYNWIKLRVFAWGLNIIALFFDIFLASYSRYLISFDNLFFVGSIIGGLLVWFYPNYIYFSKRRFLFKN